MPDMKILLISDTTNFALTDVYHGYEKAMRSLNIPSEPFPFHRFRKLYSEEMCYHVMHSTALIKDKEITHLMFIGGLNIPTFMYNSLYHLKSVVVATEDPHTFDPMKSRLDQIDYYFSNERSVGENKKFPNTYYCPTAGCSWECGRLPLDRLDPQYHSDILFLGAVYPNRQKMLEALIPLVKRHKLTFKICGHVGYMSKKSPLWEFVSDARTIPHNETISYYNGAKLVLNIMRDPKWNAHDNRKGNPYNRGRFKAESLNPRSYEVPLCQTFLLQDDTRPEARDVFNEKEVGFFSDEQSLVKAVRYYLIGAGKNRREGMAMKAYRKVSENHTYAHRMLYIQQILRDSL